MQFENIINILEFFSKILGDQTEIVVHDLIESKIKWISNGHITERTENYKDDPTTMNITKMRALESPYENMIIGGSSYTKGMLHIRSSTLFLKNVNGNYQYAICVNQDLTHIDALQKVLEQYSMASKTFVVETPAPVTESIESLTKQLIFDEIEREKPFSSDSREAKLAIIQRLEDKGVFEVKGSVPIVCDYLQLAQATLYKYLKEIRQAKSSS